MGKVLDCHKVNPSNECHHVIHGATEEEVLRKAVAHAKEHGEKPNQHLLAQVQFFIEEE